MTLDLGAIKARAGYADEVACSGADEGVWTAALALSQRDVLALVTEVELLTAELANAHDVIEALRRNLNSAGDEIERLDRGERVTVGKGRHYPALPPMFDGEDHDHYSNRLIGVYGPEAYPYDHVRNRQCALGWHGECSERGLTDAASPPWRCHCPCHSVDPSRRLELG